MQVEAVHDERAALRREDLSLIQPGETEAFVRGPQGWVAVQFQRHAAPRPCGSCTPRYERPRDGAACKGSAHGQLVQIRGLARAVFRPEARIISVQCAYAGQLGAAFRNDKAGGLDQGADVVCAESIWAPKRPMDCAHPLGRFTQYVDDGLHVTGVREAYAKAFAFHAPNGALAALE